MKKQLQQIIEEVFAEVDIHLPKGWLLGDSLSQTSYKMPTFLEELPGKEELIPFSQASRMLNMHYGYLYEWCKHEIINKKNARSTRQINGKTFAWAYRRKINSGSIIYARIMYWSIYKFETAKSLIRISKETPQLSVGSVTRYVQLCREMMREENPFFNFLDLHNKAQWRLRQLLGK